MKQIKIFDGDVCSSFWIPNDKCKAVKGAIEKVLGESKEDFDIIEGPYCPCDILDNGENIGVADSGGRIIAKVHTNSFDQARLFAMSYEMMEYIEICYEPNDHSTWVEKVEKFRKKYCYTGDCALPTKIIDRLKGKECLHVAKK